MSGPRQRQSAGPTTALESAEAGISRPLVQGIMERSPRISSKFVRRRKSSKSVVCMGPLTRAQMRRFLLRLQKNPHLFSIPLACMVTVTMLFGIMTVLGIRHSSSNGSSSPDHVSLTRKLKAQTASAYKMLQRPKTRADAHKVPIADAKHEPHHNRQKSVEMSAMEILISSIRPSISSFNFPVDDHFNKELGLFIDFGGLEVTIFEDDGAERHILRDFKQEETNYRDPNAARDDDVDAYYFFDDDYLRGLDNAADENGAIDKNKRCRKITDHGLNLQNCNEFHQLDRLDPSHQIKYLNAGAYRQVFSIVRSYSNQTELIAIKDISTDHDLTYDDYEFVRMDAVVAERLSASPRIYDIYGFCGIGILSEYFYHGDIEGDVTGGDDGFMQQKELHDEEEVKPQNNLTGIEKLVLALEMAESLADLHGYVNGVITHDDVQLSQYLLNKDKTRLKLNDFNRAEFRLFSEESNEYCKWSNGKGHGNWRSPEEYKDQPLTEQIDVWSLGNNIYTLLTGLGPLYDVEHNDEFRKKITNGETAYIDPRYKERSPSEAELVELIPKCFVFKPEDRLTIFEVVHFLREAVKKNLSVGMTQEKVLQGITTRQ